MIKWGLGATLLLLLAACSPTPEPTPAKSNAPVPAPGAAVATNKHPLAKYIEVDGFRITESGAGKLKITFAVINHSEADIGDLGLKVTLTTSAAKPGDAPGRAIRRESSRAGAARKQRGFRVLADQNACLRIARLAVSAGAVRDHIAKLMTERLYYDDCYLRDFRARVVVRRRRKTRLSGSHGVLSDLGRPAVRPRNAGRNCGARSGR